MDYQYTYLIWTGIFFLIWLGVYLWRKDIRKEMLFISFLFGLGGIISQFIYIEDWWHPLTITKTIIGIEDFLIGFFIGGIAAVVYEEVFKKKVYVRKNPEIVTTRFIFRLLYTGALLIAIFLASFYILKINSFYSSIIGLVVPMLIMWAKRKDFILDSLATGCLLTFIGIIVYLILHIIQPGFIQAFWYLKDAWYAKLVLGVPLGEYVWYFLIGAFIGPLYEFWQEGRLKKLRK